MRGSLFYTASWPYCRLSSSQVGPTRSFACGNAAARGMLVRVQEAVDNVNWRAVHDKVSTPFKLVKK